MQHFPLDALPLLQILAQKTNIPFWLHHKNY